MGKINENKGLHGQRASRSLLAITLAASLAAFGCTTNQNLGNGTPTRSGPDVRTAPTSGVTTGGETYTPPVPPPLPQSMTSSYTRAEALPTVTARVTPRATARPVARGTERVIRRSPDQAAAIMAGRQALGGRYLGVVSPGMSNQQYVSANFQTGAFQNPALRANPQVTINSSISSEPMPAISSGAGEGVFDASGALTTATTGTTAAATIAGDTTTTATSAATIPVGTFAATGTLPTVASSGIPSVTAASLGTGRSTVAGASTAGTTTGTTAAATVSTPTTAIGSASGAVRLTRGTNGSVTVTNTTSSSTATPARSTGRNQ